MKSFKEYIIEQKKGTYAAVRPDTKTALALLDFMHSHGIPNPEPTDKLRATLLYSRKHLPDYTANPHLKHATIAKAFDVWKTKSGKNCLVMKVKSTSLSQRHSELMDAHDATYDFDEYKPHISLSYDIGDFDISKLDLKKLPTFLILTGEYQEDLDTTGR